MQRLRELGWIEGRTVAIEYRWAEGRTERFDEIAAVDERARSGAVRVLLLRGHCSQSQELETQEDAAC